MENCIIENSKSPLVISSIEKSFTIYIYSIYTQYIESVSAGKRRKEKTT